MKTLLILASRSAARAGLLRAAGYAFSQMPSDVDEDVAGPTGSLEDHVRNLAIKKARAVARLRSDAYVIGADTALLAEGQLAGKAGDAKTATHMLLRLAGKTHPLSTGVCVIAPARSPAAGAIRCEAATAHVTLRPWPESQIKAYVETVRPFHCAGAYALQADGSAIIERIEGDPSAVVGLPVGILERLLSELGYSRG